VRYSTVHTLPVISQKVSSNLANGISNRDIHMRQRWADIDFLTPDPYPKRFLNIHIQSLSENFWNLVSDIHPYPNATLAKYKTNRPSTSGPLFLKTYSSIACNMTLIHCKCAAGWTTLGRNLVNLNLTLIKPKPHIWPQVWKVLKKVNKNRYHEKCNYCNQNKWCPIMTRFSMKTIHTVRQVYLTTMTVLLMWQTQRFVLTVSLPEDL